MRILFCKKDGGPYSKATGYWLFEAKSFASVVLLRFDKGSRDAFHTHAFDAVSWVLYGGLRETFHDGGDDKIHLPSLTPIKTPKETFHKVFGVFDHTWVLSFRGPWVDEWREYLPGKKTSVVLTHGRKEVSSTDV